MLEDTQSNKEMESNIADEDRVQKKSYNEMTTEEFLKEQKEKEKTINELQAKVKDTKAENTALSWEEKLLTEKRKNALLELSNQQLEKEKTIIELQAKVKETKAENTAFLWEKKITHREEEKCYIAKIKPKV